MTAPAHSQPVAPPEPPGFGPARLLVLAAVLLAWMALAGFLAARVLADDGQGRPGERDECSVCEGTGTHPGVPGRLCATCGGHGWHVDEKGASDDR